MLLMEYSKTEIENVPHKPCPLCGNTKLFVTEQENYESLCKEHGHSLIGIQCRVCDVELKMYNIPNNNYWLGLGMLIGKWNTRNGGGNNAD